MSYISSEIIEWLFNLLEITTTIITIVVCSLLWQDFGFCLVDQWLTLASHLGLVDLPNYGIGQYQLGWSTRRGLGICLIHWILDFAAHASCYFPATQPIFYNVAADQSPLYSVFYSSPDRQRTPNRGAAPLMEKQTGAALFATAAHPWWPDL